MSDLDLLRQAEEELVSRLNKVRLSIEKLEKPKLGKLPNTRAGFYHIHSSDYECGIAYVVSYVDQGGARTEYAPCRKLVNHNGDCGYEDNSAF